MDEQKTYSIIGQVTIGTDEYRDLISRSVEAEKARDRYMSEGWAKDSIIREKDEQLAKLRTELDKYKEFVRKNSTVFTPEMLVSLTTSTLGD